MAVATEGFTTDKIIGAIKRVLKNSDQQLNLADLDMKLVISGKHWSGVVDSKVARFIISLDRQIQAEAYNIGLDLNFSDRGVIALRISDGSFEGIFEYSKDFLAQLKKLTPLNQVILIAIILGAIGLFKASDIISAIQAEKLELIKMTTDKNRSEAENSRLEQYNETIEKITILAKGQQDGLVKQLFYLIPEKGTEDTVYLPGQNNPISGDWAIQKTFEAPPRDLEPIYVDGEYQIRMLARSEEGMRVAKVYHRESKTEFLAEVSLAGSDLKNFLRLCYKCDEEEKSVDLQISAQFATGERWCMYHPKIVGLGAARASAVDFAQAVSGLGN